MASDLFYALNKRKIRDFYRNFADLLANKDALDIVVDDILEYSGVSRSTFYNYFNDINELYDDFIEYILKLVFEEAEKESIKTKSIFSTAFSIHEKGIKILGNKKYEKVVWNLINVNNRIIRTIFSQQMEQYIFDLVDSFIINTVEGKKINDISRIYTLVNSIACALQVSFESFVCKKYDKSLTVCLFDFDYEIKMLQDGYKKKYN